MPREVGRVLPGDPADLASRWPKCEVYGLRVVSVHLPNGNRVRSPNFDYKLRWMDRLVAHGETLLAMRQPVVLAGDFNVVPENFDIHDAVDAAVRDQVLRSPGCRVRGKVVGRCHHCQAQHRSDDLGNHVCRSCLPCAHWQAGRLRQAV